MEADQLPRNWALATIEDVAEYVQRGKSPKYADLSDLPVINQKCVRWNGLEKEFVKYVHEDQIAKWDEVRYLKKGDLLWNSTGTGTIGRACLYKGEFPRAVVDSHVTIVRSNSKIADPGYMHFFVMSPLVQKNFEAMQSGSTNQVELSRAAVLEKQIPVPPLTEQRRIVDKIESLFAQLDHGEAGLRDVQKLLARYRQSVLKAAVTGQLTAEWRAENADRLESGSDLLERILQARRENWQGRGKYKEPVAPDASELPELPEGWVWAALPMLGEFGRGKSKHRPRNDPKLYVNGKYPFLQTGRVRNSDGVISNYDALYNDLGLAQSKLWPKGTVCITIAANIAESGILDIDACFPDSVVGLVPDDEICAEYVECFIRTAKGNLDRYAPATAQKNINLEILKGVAVPLPPKEEQLEIKNRLEQAFSAIKQTEIFCVAELARSSALRQSILKDAFAGKLVPQDPGDEPASELLARIRAERDAAAPKKRTRKKVTA